MASEIAIIKRRKIPCRARFQRTSVREFTRGEIWR
nr:MAG TPA_asm: hypothetical protein [Bacteriophage sp.]